MNFQRRCFFVVILLGLLFSAAACGNPTPAPAPATARPQAVQAQPTIPAPTTTSATAPSAVAATPTAESSLQDVRRSTVRIEASGSFRAPEGMKQNSGWSGTGFVVDPSGLVVTNNHVVTGAAIVKVWVSGEQQPRNAKVLGVSECSDLALLQIEGDPLPALKWYEGAIEPGLDVYAAGYPLGDPEYTLTRGIISKAKADGQTNWASVPSVIEHDAVLNPGNSGGPLVTKDGKVVGVNYASASKARQSFAISPVEAEKVLQQLRQGHDVDSIGLNAEAFLSDDNKTSGVWIYSVKSGSPADRAGLKAGDILTQLEGVTLAAKGTMAEYCDILHTHDPQATLSMTVERADSNALMEGQINGRTLAETKATVPQGQGASQGGGGNQGGSGGQTGGAGGQTEFVTRRNSTGVLEVQVPQAWTDVSSGVWNFNNQQAGIKIAAAPDLNKWQKGFDTNGAFYGVSRQLAGQYTPEKLLDEQSFSKTCTYEGRKDYNDAANGLKGVYDLYTNCDGGTGRMYEIAAMPADKSYIMLIQIIAVTDQDLNNLDRLLEYKLDAGKLPAQTAEPAPSTPPPAAAAPPILVTIQKYDYSKWGRPAEMDDPNKPCGNFDNSRPVKKLTASLRVENHSDQAMTDWYASFYKPDGTAALTCYQGYDSGFPDIAPGKAVDITFSAYIEPNETISYGVVDDAQVGKSARLKFP